MSITVDSARDWRLWLDWCAATGLHPHAATDPDVAAYLSATPRPEKVQRARARHLLTMLVENLAAPVTPAAAPQQVGSLLRTGDEWASVPEALTLLRFDAYPAGVPARRDAALIVAATLGLSRAHLTRLSVRDAAVTPWPSIAEVDAPYRPDPDVCPGCAIARWLAVLAADWHGGRELVRSVVESATTGHECRDDPSYPSPPDGPLFPGVDKHGWLSTRPLTARSITRVFATRMAAAPVWQSTHADAATAAVVATYAGHRERVDRRALEADLSRFEERLDALLASTQALYDEAFHRPG